MSGEHTRGPWAWFGNSQNRQVYLATTHSGRKFVMGFERWGLQGAQPNFQVAGIMEPCSDLLQFEVGDQSIVGVDAAKADSGVYRMDIRGIANADARLIAAAPDLLAALEEIARMTKRKQLPLTSEINEIVLAAIARATGAA